VRLLHVAGGRPPLHRARPRQDRQHRLDALVPGRHPRALVHRFQERHRWHHPAAGQRVGGQGRERQCDRTGLHGHRQHRAAARRRRPQPRDPRPHPGRALGRTVRPGRYRRVPVQQRIGLRQRRGASGRRRLAGALTRLSRNGREDGVLPDAGFPSVPIFFRRDAPAADGAGTPTRNQEAGMRPWIAICLLLCGLAVVPAAAAEPEPRRVFLVGDSTASEYPPERAPREGWGMRMQPRLAPGWELRNHARSGRSARSFIEEGWLQPVADDLRAGDVLLIQFGQDDAKVEDPWRYSDPDVAYPRWLSRYLALARERGATPVLVTPVARRKFDGAQLLDTHGPYPQAVRDL